MDPLSPEAQARGKRERDSFNAWVTEEIRRGKLRCSFCDHVITPDELSSWWGGGYPPKLLGACCERCRRRGYSTQWRPEKE